MAPKKLLVTDEVILVMANLTVTYKEVPITAYDRAMNQKIDEALGK